MNAITPRPQKHEWSAADLDRAREMSLSGCTPTAIAKELGRSTGAVAGKLWRKGWTKKADGPVRKNTTAAQVEEIKRLAALGIDAKDIAVTVGVGRGAIEYQAKKAGIRVAGMIRPEKRSTPAPELSAQRKLEGLAASRARGTAASRLVPRDRMKGHGETEYRAALPIRPYNPMPVAPARCCQWPFGYPRTPDFRLCEAVPLVGGRSYCAAHAAVAYTLVPSRLRRMEAA